MTVQRPASTRSLPPQSGAKAPPPLKRQIIALVVAALLPLVLLAAGLTAVLVRSEKSVMERALLENARAVSYAVDAELQRSLAALQTLGLHESLRRGDLEAFYQAAREARDALGIWDSALVLGPKGEHLLNLLRPFGAPLPPLSQPQAIVETARTAKTFISNNIVGTVNRQPLVYLTSPVVIDGRVKYVLEATIPYRYWSGWLAQRAPNGATVALLDRDHVILGRSQDADRLAGKAVQPWFKAELESRSEGIVRGQGVAASDVLAPFYRSELSGWTVNLVLPGAVIDRPVWRAALALLIGCIVVVAMAIGLASWRAGVLTHGIELIEHALERLRTETPTVAFTPSRVAEIDAAIDAARHTAQVLTDRKRQIDELQAALSARADELERERTLLQQALHELRKADRAKDEFLAMLAHELRNPLAPLSNAHRLLERSAALAGTDLDILAMAKRQTTHLTRLVDDLLEVSRITQGKIELRLETVLVDTVVRQVAESVAHECAARRHELTLDLAPAAEPIEADPVRLAQILENLLANACKYTPDGGRLRVVVEDRPGEVEIRVIDNGVGIEPAHLADLFEVFHQVDATIDRSHGGLGIGLALVRRLVELHGGSVRADSAGPGRGAVFTVRLPRRPCP